MKLLLIFSVLLTFQDAISATSPLCPGQQGYFYTNYRVRNPQAGGFVANTAFVDDNDRLFLAPSAAVCDSAQVYGSARILGTSVVRGNSEVYENANLKGSVIVEGDSRVYGNARIQDQAIVRNSDISGTVVLKGWFKAINITLSSGEHFGAQYSDAELETQRRYAEKKAKAIQHKANLVSILRNKYVGLANYVSSHTSHLNGQALLENDSDTCKLKFKYENYEIVDGVGTYFREDYDTLNMSESHRFTKGFFSVSNNNPNIFTELAQVHPTFITPIGGWGFGFAPSLVLGTKAYVFSEEHQASRRMWFEDTSINEPVIGPFEKGGSDKVVLVFSTLEEREKFFTHLSDLYHSCPFN